MSKKKKILVTGATGFIGLEVAKQLSKKGYQPRLLVRRPLRAGLLSSLDADIIQGDLSSKESLARCCKGVDTIIHLGARAVFEEYDLVKPTIVDGSVNLMQAAIEANVKQFLFASSLLVYDSQSSPITKETPTQPRCGYGVAKVKAEQLLKNLAEKNSVNLSIIRLPHVYGARDLMFEEVRRGRVFYPGNGENHFAHLHIQDAAKIFIEVIEQDWTGITPIADHLPVNWIEYFSEIRKYYPRFRTYSVPEWIALLFTWLIYPIRRIKKNPSVLTPGSVISWNLNLPVQKGLLWEELNIEPDFPTIYEGLPQVLDQCIPFQWIHPIKDKI